jgi:hypothetical protein
VLEKNDDGYRVSGGLTQTYKGAGEEMWERGLFKDNNKKVIMNKPYGFLEVEHMRFRCGIFKQIIILRLHVFISTPGKIRVKKVVSLLSLPSIF